MKKQKTSLLISLIPYILIALVLIVGALWIIDKPTPSAEENTRALVGGPFSLVDHQGRTVTDQDFKGQNMLIYFGYTFCPDVCPTELQVMTEAMALLKNTSVTPIFITVDPERDTTEVLAQYVPLFHPDLIGLGGTVEQVVAVKKAYRVWAEKVQEPGSSDYLVDHTSIIYLMDRDGRYLGHFSYGTKPEDMARRIEALIE